MLLYHSCHFLYFLHMEKQCAGDINKVKIFPTQFYFKFLYLKLLHGSMQMYITSGNLTNYYTGHNTANLIQKHSHHFLRKKKN